MMALIPVLVGSTLIAIEIASMSASDGKSEFAESWRFSMMMAHAASIKLAGVDNAAAGSWQPPARWPFINVDDWQSELVVDGDRKVLLTWSNADDVPAGSLETMLPLLDRLVGGASAGRGHFGGRFALADGGGAVVGMMPVPPPATAISSGTLVVGSWIR